MSMIIGHCLQTHLGRNKIKLSTGYIISVFVDSYVLGLGGCSVTVSVETGDVDLVVLCVLSSVVMIVEE